MRDRAFSTAVTNFLHANLSEEQYAEFQKLTYEEQYLLFCIPTKHNPITWIQVSDDNWTKQEINPTNRLLHNPTPAMQGLVNRFSQFDNLNTFYFDKYSPVLVNSNSFPHLNTKKTQNTVSPQPQKPAFYILGPGVDAYGSAGWKAFKYAIVQAASQANALEFASAEPNDPLDLSGDRTQGPAIQKGCPALALARHLYYEKLPADQKDIFLLEFRKQTISDGTKSYTFDQIFELRHGYMHPREGWELAALHFIQQHKDKLFINVEHTEFTKNGNPLIQALTFAMALGDYDGPNFDGTRPDGTKFTRTPEAQGWIQQACTELLSAQYEMIAKIAITEAMENPDRRIPLVLTSVGGGVFKNPKESVDAAVMKAMQTITDSGVGNIAVVISAYSDQAVNDYKELLNKNEIEFTQLKKEDFSSKAQNGETVEMNSFAEAAEFKRFNEQAQLKKQPETTPTAGQPVPPQSSHQPASPNPTAGTRPPRPKDLVDRVYNSGNLNVKLAQEPLFDETKQKYYYLVEYISTGARARIYEDALTNGSGLSQLSHTSPLRLQLQDVVAAYGIGSFNSNGTLVFNIPPVAAATPQPVASSGSQPTGVVSTAELVNPKDSDFRPNERYTIKLSIATDEQKKSYYKITT